MALQFREKEKGPDNSKTGGKRGNSIVLSYVKNQKKTGLECIVLPAGEKGKKESHCKCNEAPENLVWQKSNGEI